MAEAQQSQVTRKPENSAIIQQLQTIPKNNLNKNWLMYYFFVRKNYDLAMQLIQQVQTQYDENHEFANQIKGLILRQQGNISSSFDSLKKCHTFNEKNPETLKHISKTLLLQGKYKASIDVASEAIKQNKKDWENYFTLSECFQNLKEDEKSLDMLKKANSISQHEDTYIALGRYYYVRKMYEEAIQVYKQGLEHSLENTEIMQILGYLYLRMGQNAEAFQYLGSALSLDPKDCSNILSVSSIMQDQSEYDKALARYRQMAMINPDSSQLWNNIAMCYFGKKRNINAIACLKRALYLDPFEYLTCLNLGLVFYTTEQYASAFHYFSASIELNPQFATSYMYIGLCLHKLNDYHNACLSFDKSMQLDQQEDYLIPLNFAILLAQKKENHTKAKEMASLFVQRFKNFEDDSRVNLEDVQKQKQLLQNLLGIQIQ